jgi:hypothetical protein
MESKNTKKACQSDRLLKFFKKDSETALIRLILYSEV